MRQRDGSTKRASGMESELRSLFRAAQRWDASERAARDAHSADNRVHLSAHGIDSEDVFVRRALRVLRVDMEGSFLPRQRARLASLSKVRSQIARVTAHCRVPRPQALSHGLPPAPPWRPSGGLARRGRNSRRDAARRQRRVGPRRRICGRIASSPAPLPTARGPPDRVRDVEVDFATAQRPRGDAAWLES